MTVSVALMPLRFDSRDKPLVVPQPVWRAMLKLSARFGCPVQDHLPPYQGREFARALTRGLEWLDTNEAPAGSRSAKFAASLSLLSGPSVRNQVEQVVVLCQANRGLHYTDRITG